MAKRLDIPTGTKYGRLTVIKEISKKGDSRRFLCQCDCGNEKEVDLRNLRSGNVKSCGKCNYIPIKIGDVYGRWIVIGKARRKTKYGHLQWLCECSCDKHTIRYVDEQNLKKGLSLSCGCLTSEETSKRRYKHGYAKTRLFTIWVSMKDRCNNLNDPRYEAYGGRGIKVCDEWENDFVTFKNWALANGYTNELTIDRKDVNGNYEPTNCQWATWLEQANNKRNNLKIEYKGEIHTASEWGRILKFNAREIRRLYHKGYSLEEIIKMKGVETIWV